MPHFDRRLLELVRVVGEEALAAGRRADDAHADECDELLTAILEASSKMCTASAYLRKAARPRSVSGFGETHDRMRDTIDELSITVDEICDDRGDDVSEDVLEWGRFLADHPELEGGSDDAS